MKHPPSTHTARERGFTAQSCRSLKDEVGYKRPHAVHPATPINKLSQTPAYRSVLLLLKLGDHAGAVCGRFQNSGENGTRCR